MKALVLPEPGVPFEIQDVPDPVARPGEAVARVISCGAGLTIQHMRAGRAAGKFPLIIGHEITGQIVATGDGVGDLAVGDAVTIYFYLNCGKCRWCTSGRESLCENFGGFVGRQVDGAYAEYIKLPSRNFVKYPDGIDWQGQPEAMGVVTDALATPYKVMRRARIAEGESVAVIGAGGGLGIHQLMMCRRAGGRTIAVDVAADKFDACRTAGADEVVDASDGTAVEQLMELTDGKGIDVAIDYVSSKSTLETGAAALGRGGRLVTLGGSGEHFSADASNMLNKELELIGSRYCTREEVIATLELVAAGEVTPLVTEIADFHDVAAVEALHDRVEQGLVTGRAALRMIPAA